MRLQFPTAWMSLVVQQITRQFNKGNDIDIESVCQWDGQDVVLTCDHSPGTKVDRAYITSLEVGDRILVRGEMTVTPFFDVHKNAVMRLSLLVHEAKATLKRTDESTGHESGSHESGSHESGSHESGSHESGSHESSSHESNSCESRSRESSSHESSNHETRCRETRSRESSSDESRSRESSSDESRSRESSSDESRSRESSSHESSSHEPNSCESRGRESGSHESSSHETRSRETSSDEFSSDESRSRESGSHESRSRESSSDESSSDESNSDESDSDESDSDESGSGESRSKSSSGESSSGESRSHESLTICSDGPGQEDLDEEIDYRSPRKRARTFTASNNPRRRGRGTGDPHGSKSDSNHQEDANSDRGHAEHGNSSLVRCARDHEVLARRTPGFGLAGSVPRVYGQSFNAEEGGQQARYEFNGRGQPIMFSKPLRQINDRNMAAQESIDTLIVYENIFGPIHTGLISLGRILR